MRPENHKSPNKTKMKAKTVRNRRKRKKKKVENQTFVNINFVHDLLLELVGREVELAVEGVEELWVWVSEGQE